MIITKHTISTKASAKTVWALYANPKSWPQWDHGIEWVTQDGPLARGTRGKLKPKGGPVVRFEIVEATLHKSFTDVSHLPLTKLTFQHTLKPEGDLLHLTHEVKMTGLLAWFFAIVIGRGIKKDMPAVMQKLAHMAEVIDGK